MHPLRLKLAGYANRTANYLRLGLAAFATAIARSDIGIKSTGTAGTAGTSNTPRPATRPQSVDVSDHYADLDIAPMQVLRDAPVWMTAAERLSLYSLIYGTRPQRYLEIGTFYGGSALIVCAAMDALANHQNEGHYDGRMVCLDPAHQVSPDHRARIAHRATLLEGFSPGALVEAERRAGGRFDFVLIDGDHSYASVLSDFTGVLTHLNPDAYLLFHDAFHPDVGRAIADGYMRNHTVLVDCGYVTREVTRHKESGQAAPQVRESWCGLRLFRYHPELHT
jgi:predicted O-methyltransferase YrrM